MIHDTGTTRRRLADRLGGADGWTISESGLALSRPGARESVFAVGNGYLGLRGTPEEGGPAEHPGVVLNGFHETWPIVYPEDAYGMARTGQTIVNATDGTIIRLFVDDEPFDPETARVLRRERVLDLRTGVLRRELEFETARGGRVLLRSRRLASLDQRHLAAMDYELHALDEPVSIAVSSELVTHSAAAEGDDPRRGRAFRLEPIAAHARETRALLRLATRESGLELACGMEHRVLGGSTSVSVEPDRAALVVLAGLEPRMPLRLSKYVAYHWGRAGEDLGRRASARWTARRLTATTRSSGHTHATSRTSGSAATSSSRARPRSSSPSASTSSSCCRRRRAARVTASPPRA
jgi:alpha,alpha-trehalose phosphorylase